MHPIKTHSERLKKYESFQSKYDFISLTYLVPLKYIDAFCRRNNCSINVYGISGGKDDQGDIEGDDIQDEQEHDDGTKDDNDDTDDNAIEDDDDDDDAIEDDDDDDDDAIEDDDDDDDDEIEEDIREDDE